MARRTHPTDFGRVLSFRRKVSPINSLTEQIRYKATVKRALLAVALACGLTTCVAFATTTDIVALFLGIIVTAIAKMLLNAADIIVTPLLAITSMTTQEIEAYIPGLNNSDPNGVGNFFSSAISIIAYTIAGVLLCCHIISYLIALANDERLESIPKLIWNGMFGIVLTIAGKNLLSLLFNEIIAPLSEALVDGMQSAGGMSFTFEGKANDIISLGDGISAFDLSALGTLLVVLAMLLLIWWNLIKLILECAQRYIICIVTINLSPLAFATATTEQTKQTAVNWLKMFWSQCVLLVLNIWVVGIARTALNNGMIGGSSTELVTWALITYAFLKIAQQLDDMMANAGLKVTSMNGIDPLSEANGVLNQLTGIGKHFGDALGYSKGALDTLFGNKSSEGGKPPLTEEDIVRAESDFDKSDVERRNDLRQGTINPASYDDDAHKKAMENVLKTEGVLNNDEQVEGVKIGEDGSLHATAVKRDDRGRVASSREIKATNTGDGLGLTPDETPTSTMRVGNGGKSAIISNEKGTFKLEAQGKNDLGENVWKATQLTDADGNKISDIAPGADASQVFTVDADWDDDAQHKKDGYAASAAAFFTENQDTNDSIMDDLNRQTYYAAEDKRMQDRAEQRDFTNKIGMTDEDRIANMMDSEAAVDYNSDNAKKAMEDYIMENKEQNPGLAPFAEALEKGGHITSMSLADGSNPAVPQGALQFEITHPKILGDKNPDITAGAISNPATAAPTPSATAESYPVQNEQPESVPTAKQDAQGEEGTNAGQPTAQSADATAVDKKPDKEPAPVDAEAPLESTSVPEIPNGAPTGEALDNSAVVGDESPIEATTKPNAEQEVPDTVGIEQSVEAPAPIDATQPLDGDTTPNVEDNPTVEPIDATTGEAGSAPTVNAADSASSEPQDANIPATEQAAAEVQSKPDTQGDVPQAPMAGVQAEAGAAQNEIGPETIQGQGTAPIANEASQPAVSVSAKRPDGAAVDSSDMTPQQNPVTASAASPMTMDSAPTTGTSTNGATASNPQKTTNTISSSAGEGAARQAPGAEPVSATTTQATPTGTTQAVPLSSQPQAEAGTVPGPAATAAPSTATQGSVQNIPDSSTNVGQTPAPTVSAVGSETPSANASAHGLNATTQTIEGQSTQTSVSDTPTAAAPAMQSAENSGVGSTAPATSEAPVNAGSTSDADVTNAAPVAQTASEAHEPDTAGTANAMPASDGTPYMSGEGVAPTTVDAAPETTGQTAQAVVDATAPTDSSAAVTLETTPTDSDVGNVTESSDAASDTTMVSDESDTASADGGSSAQNSDSTTVQNATEESGAPIATETHELDSSALTSETSSNSSDTTDTVADTVGDSTSDDSVYEPTNTGVANSVGSEGASDDGMAATSPVNDSNVAASSSDSVNDGGDEPDFAYTPHSSSDDGDNDETVHDASSVTDKHSDNASYNEDADDVDTATFEADDAPIADGAGFYGEGTGNSFKESETKSTTDSNESPAVESGTQSNPTDEPDATAGTVTETTAVPDAKQDVGEAASQVQAEAVTQQSSEQAETVSIPSVPQGIVLSNTSVNKLSDTNGTIRSASAGVFQLTREGLDEDTGKTVWRATLKQDAEGNPVTDYSANTFTFERTAKWNAQTRSYQPEGFDSVAKEVREAVDFRDISQSANQGRGSRRSDKPQNQPERERFKRERNPKAYTDDARLTEGRRTTSTSRGGKHRAQRKSDTAKKRDNPLKNMDGFKTKR